MIKGVQTLALLQCLIICCHCFTPYPQTPTKTKHYATHFHLLGMKPYCCSYFPYCLFSFILLIHQLFNFPITLLAPVGSVQSSIHVFLCSPCFFLVSQQFLLNVFAPPQSLLVHFLYFWWRIKYPTTCLPDHLSCSSLHLNQSIILRVTTLCCMATLS